MKKGFTLIEVVISITIFTMLCGIVTIMIVYLGKANNTAERTNQDISILEEFIDKINETKNVYKDKDWYLNSTGIIIEGSSILTINYTNNLYNYTFHLNNKDYSIITSNEIKISRTHNHLIVIESLVNSRSFIKYIFTGENINLYEQ